MAATYTARDIQVLRGLEPVRLRPGMFIGNTSTTGLHHLVTEALDNAVDEALKESLSLFVNLFDGMFPTKAMKSPLSG